MFPELLPVREKQIVVHDFESWDARAELSVEAEFVKVRIAELVRFLDELRLRQFALFLLI